jgi:isopenicillin-N epimerase
MVPRSARPVRSSLAVHWSRLEAGVVFLNHGSFGACPDVVLQAQQRWRDRMERQPVRFFVDELEEGLDLAREALGGFLHADPAQLAWVPNATTGVATVLAGLSLSVGDVVLTTDHAYNACRNILDAACRRTGATLDVVPLPLPVPSTDDVVERVLAQAGPRVRLVMLDHITSPTGLVMPLETLVPALRARGIPVLVDGAHAAGMIPLDLGALGATWYTGNCHKWLCTPKGSGFLWVEDPARAALQPLVISHAWNSSRQDRSGFHQAFDWTGTQDFTPWLCLPTALTFLASLEQGGMAAHMGANTGLAEEAGRLLADTLAVPRTGPASMQAALAAVVLPPGPPGQSQDARGVDPLQRRLQATWGIEVPIMPVPGRAGRICRISAQRYNAPEEYAWLCEALQQELASEQG